MYFTVILRSEATKNIKTLKFCNQTLRSAQGDNSDSRRQIAAARFWVVRNRDPLNHLIRLVPRHLLLEEKAKVSTNQAFSLRRRGTACGG